MGKKRDEVDGELNITSMMDMMTIILVFLLKSFGENAITVKPSDKMRLPFSNAEIQPQVAVSVVVQKDMIVVDNNRVLDLDSETNPNDPSQQLYKIPEDMKVGTSLKVDPLYKAFETSAKAAKDLAKLAGDDRDDLKFKGRLLFQVDKDIPFSLLREVMFNAGQAEFSEFEFVVIQSGG